MSPLRKRKEDIYLLFKKFSRDFCEKNKIPIINLSPDGVESLKEYDWPGNIRELKNFAEKISIIERKRQLSSLDIDTYLPKKEKNSIIFNQKSKFSEREILYKMLFEMKQDLNELKEMTSVLCRNKEMYDNKQDFENRIETNIEENQSNIIQSEIEETVQENLSLETQELNIIKKALEKNRGKRKMAAKELGISERTLYRKIKQYDL